MAASTLSCSYKIEAYNTDEYGVNLVKISLSARNEDDALDKAKKLTSRQYYEVVKINSTPWKSNPDML